MDNKFGGGRNVVGENETLSVAACRYGYNGHTVALAEFGTEVELKPAARAPASALDAALLGR